MRSSWSPTHTSGLSESRECCQLSEMAARPAEARTTSPNGTCGTTPFLRALLSFSRVLAEQRRSEAELSMSCDFCSLRTRRDRNVRSPEALRRLRKDVESQIEAMSV